MLSKAARGPEQHTFKNIIRNRNGASKAHVFGWRVNTALGGIGQNRRDQSSAQRLSNSSSQHLGARVVFAYGHMGAVLLGASNGNNHCSLTSLERRTDFLRG